mmetsp:Transcript_15567/g.23187  ORF Transcript_15567/g.23187 Transcript_15567/m.23187 type:complete len:334 (-) Transcript_15567:4-1005(-)
MIISYRRNFHQKTFGRALKNTVALSSHFICRSFGTKYTNKTRLDKILGSYAPYGRLARLDKPMGIPLLLAPTWWGAAIATDPNTFFDLKVFGILLTGTVASRTAGCVINDIWDKDFDKQVERTKHRPLESGELSLIQAFKLLGGSLSLSLLSMLSLNTECWKIGVAALPLMAIYPLSKRFTWWPQLVQGLAMNFGVFMGYAAVHGSVEFGKVLPLYSAGICWTMVYDTIYGHQDKKYDEKLGLKSTSLLFGERTKPILYCFSVASIGSLVLAGIKSDLTLPFYLSASVASLQLFWQINKAQLNDPENLYQIFSSNKWFGGIVLLGIVSGKNFL